MMLERLCNGTFPQLAARNALALKGLRTGAWSGFFFTLNPAAKALGEIRTRLALYGFKKHPRIYHFHRIPGADVDGVRV